MSKLYTVTVFTENRVGLLNQISIIFTRRCLNIESLSVSPSSIPGIHKFTITVWSDRSTLAKVTKQIVYQEIALYKVPTEQLLDEKELEKIIRRYNARILEMDRTFTVIEMTGHSDETSALFNDLKKYGILQFVRSGRVAVTKTDEELLNMYLENQEKRLQRIEQQCSNQ